jgi:hypothetical protein
MADDIKVPNDYLLSFAPPYPQRPVRFGAATTQSPGRACDLGCPCPRHDTELLNIQSDRRHDYPECTSLFRRAYRLAPLERVRLLGQDHGSALSKIHTSRDSSFMAALN